VNKVQGRAAAQGEKHRTSTIQIITKYRSLVLVDASRRFLYDNLVGRLAQRLERSVYTRKVEGSNPSVPTM
jgi:hypothetical protein